MNPGAGPLGKPPNIAINSQALAMLEQGREEHAKLKGSMEEASEMRPSVREGHNRSTEACVIGRVERAGGVMYTETKSNNIICKHHYCHVYPLQQIMTGK